MKRAFGNILYELRMGANLTQADLAKSAGLSQSAISRLEKGYRWPEFRTMRVLSKVFNTTVDGLLDLTAKEIRKPEAKNWTSLDDDEEEKEND